jgi:hypothetical protein
MSDSVFLSLCEETEVSSQDPDRITFRYGARASTFNGVSLANREVLMRVARTGAFEDELTDAILDAEGFDALSKFHYYIAHLGQIGALRRSILAEDRPLATLIATSPYFRYAGHCLDPDRTYRLSRFAYVRADERGTVVESPLSHARIVLHDWRAAALVHVLACPGPAPIPLSDATKAQLTTLLLNVGMLAESGDAGEPQLLRSWEFHDLLFHSRSRMGRHDLPVGGTYRFAGQIDPPPALKTTRSEDCIDLWRPDLERIKREDPPFALVQETRCSVREFGANPITLQQLGEFLYRVGRVTKLETIEVVLPQGSSAMDFARRPYPGGGALYELELYLAVQACDGLTAGIYRYVPLSHRMERICGPTAHLDELLAGAGAASGIAQEELQVLVVIASRFQRLAWSMRRWHTP